MSLARKIGALLSAASGVIDTTHGGTPAGAVISFAGASAPSGWLLCYGQAVSRTTYAALFAAIGTTYGAGDGSTTFALPDLRGRVVAANDNMGGTPANRLTTGGGGVNGAVLGAVGGSETHTLTTAQMPQHSHGVTDPGHIHAASFRLGTAAGALSFAYGGYNDNASQGVTVASATTGISIQNNGSGNAHPNVQPTIVMNHIIKV